LACVNERSSPAQERLVLTVGMKEHVETHRRSQPGLGAVRRRDRAAHAGQEIVERAIQDREQISCLDRK
jgi:hypothetical protein